MRMLKALSLSMISLILLSSTGCSTTCEPVVSTEYMVRVPKKVDRPTPPKLDKLNSEVSLESKTNFKILQSNLSKIKVYVSELLSTVNYYETMIDELDRK
jgi:hypothetical protein